MPKGDRTGPFGQGPMTGRGAGFCNDFDRPGFARCRGRGRSFGRFCNWGRGMGFGRGWRWQATPPKGYYPSQPNYQTQPVNKEEEAAFLRDEMKAIQQRLNDLEKD